MPPRVPLVAVFLLCYAAAVFVGGPTSVDAFVELWSPERARGLLGAAGYAEPPAGAPEALARVWTGRLWLSLGDALALGAAVAALPDAAWRPARRTVDKLVSMAAAAAAMAAMIVAPVLATPAYSVLAALVVGDAAAALGFRRREAR